MWKQQSWVKIGINTVLMQKFCYCKWYMLPCCDDSEVERTSTDTLIFLKLFAAISDIIWTLLEINLLSKLRIFVLIGLTTWQFFFELVKFILTISKRNISPLKLQHSLQLMDTLKDRHLWLADNFFSLTEFWSKSRKKLF